MKKEIIFVVFTLLVIGVGSGFAQEKQTVGTNAEIKKQLSKALEKGLEVTVKLKSGRTLKGQVTEVTDDTFTLQQADTSFAGLINDADVASIKVQTPFLKAMKKFGNYTGKTALIAATIPVGIAALPVILFMEIIGHPICDL